MAIVELFLNRILARRCVPGRISGSVGYIPWLSCRARRSFVYAGCRVIGIPEQNPIFRSREKNRAGEKNYMTSMISWLWSSAIFLLTRNWMATPAIAEMIPAMVA